MDVELLFLDGEEAVGEWKGDDHTYGSRHYVEAARTAGTLKTIAAFVLVDMIGDKDLRIMRESNSTPWLTDVVWAAAKRSASGRVRRRGHADRRRSPRVPRGRRARGRHHRPRLPGLAPRRRHARQAVGRPLQAVGDVVLAARADIAARSTSSKCRPAAAMADERASGRDL